MVVGEIGEWLARLPKGTSVVLPFSDLQDSAKAYMESGFDCVRKEYVCAVVNEVNSEEYPGFSLHERVDGKWILSREK